MDALDTEADHREQPSMHSPDKGIRSAAQQVLDMNPRVSHRQLLRLPTVTWVHHEAYRYSASRSTT